ncbi:BgTH12-03250 [Blumeria graminis f. sp. triticale]|uniref:BgtAcSP-30210 n=2 Tax=Blumeria graminis TaxID=34373 RepID=A0A9X9MJP7_BLUGR|nr:BgTH12-03250 [Blumeria graminis f. sp. triticale]VDB89739.1 BgtAcSP-30210 [Blumeria graminis f. sp. tritici]
MRLSNLLIILAVAIVKPAYGTLDISTGVYCIGVEYTYGELEHARRENCDYVKRKLSGLRAQAKKDKERLKKNLERDKKTSEKIDRALQSGQLPADVPSFYSMSTFEITPDQQSIRPVIDTRTKETSGSTYFAHGPGYTPPLPTVDIPTEVPITLPQKGEGTVQLSMNEKCKVENVIQFRDGAEPYICLTPDQVNRTRERIQEGRQTLASMRFSRR